MVEEGPLGLALEAQLVCQLFKRFGLLHDALPERRLAELLHRHAQSHHLVGERRAADGGEAQDVIGRVAVEHLAPYATGLLGSLEAQEVVGRGLVRETHAVAVHLHERLTANVLLEDGARQRSLVALAHVAGIHARSHGAAVEDHRRGIGVFRPASPHAGLQTVAVVVDGVARRRAARQRGRLQRAHHRGIRRIAAGCQQRALGVDLHVAVVSVEDGTRHLAVVVHQLHQRVPEADLVAGFLDGGLQHLVAGGRLVRRKPYVLKHGQVVVGAAGGMRERHVHHQLLARNLHFRIDPVQQLGAFVDPNLDDVLTAFAGRIARQLVEQLHRVDFAALRQSRLRVHHAQVLAGFLNRIVLLAQDEIHSQIACRAGRAHTRRARADDEEVGVFRFDDVTRGDFRFGAQPVDRCALRALFGDRLSALPLRRATRQPHNRARGRKRAQAQETATRQSRTLRLFVHRSLLHSSSDGPSGRRFDERTLPPGRPSGFTLRARAFFSPVRSGGSSSSTANLAF